MQQVAASFVSTSNSPPHLGVGPSEDSMPGRWIDSCVRDLFSGSHIVSLLPGGIRRIQLWRVRNKLSGVEQP